jgi:predicted transcriptional regulator YdeE
MFSCEIVKKEEIRLVGMSYAGTFPDSFPASAVELHRKFWARRHEIKGANHGVLLSPYFGNESFTTYWACCEVEQFDSIPDGMSGITIPAREYAKISCTNKTIHKGYSQLHDWMKKEGLRKADKGCPIEVFYIEEAKGEEVVEILSPIVPHVPDKLVERIDAVFLPVRDLEQSKVWYQETFGFKLRWENKRFAGLGIAPNCGFHLVHVPDWKPSPNYTPINFASHDAANARERLIEKGVKVSDWLPGEPTRFDFWDNTGNIISFIQLGG